MLVGTFLKYKNDLLLKNLKTVDTSDSTFTKQDDSASTRPEAGSSNSTVLTETNWKYCSHRRHILCDV